VKDTLPGRSRGRIGLLSARILIADDSLSSRELLRFILEDSGYEVIEAADGEQVIERTPIFNPHLVIVDLHMPKLDGWAVVIALRKLPSCKKTPIVALTAAPSDAVPEKMISAGFTDYLIKPIGPARLRQCIASLL